MCVYESRLTNEKLELIEFTGTSHSLRINRIQEQHLIVELRGDHIHYTVNKYINELSVGFSLECVQ